jgi:hypothetical protein
MERKGERARARVFTHCGRSQLAQLRRGSGRICFPRCPFRIIGLDLIRRCLAARCNPRRRRDDLHEGVGSLSVPPVRCKLEAAVTRDAPRTGAIRVRDVDLAAVGALADEGDPPPIGQPGRMDLARARPRQARLTAAVRDGVEIPLAMAVTREGLRGGRLPPSQTTVHPTEQVRGGRGVGPGLHPAFNFTDRRDGGSRPGRSPSRSVSRRSVSQHGSARCSRARAPRSPHTPRRASRT